METPGQFTARPDDENDLENSEIVNTRDELMETRDDLLKTDRAMQEIEELEFVEEEKGPIDEGVIKEDPEEANQDSLILNIEIEHNQATSKQKKEFQNMKRKPFILEENQGKKKRRGKSYNKAKSAKFKSNRRLNS